MTSTTVRPSDLDSIARQPFDSARTVGEPFDAFVVGTTDDGCPILADNAPDLCENTDSHLPALLAHQRVEVWSAPGEFFCFATAGWVARQGSSLRRIGAGTFQIVGR